MLTGEELAANGKLLVVAGSETTATALCGVACFQATHFEVQRKLAQEVREGFASEGEINLFSVNKLDYMLAVLDESMSSGIPTCAEPAAEGVCTLGGNYLWLPCP